MAKPRYAKQADKVADSHDGVWMRFSEHKYYNDLNVPIFEAGVVYKLEGEMWIHRWMKRGGEIVAEPTEVEPAKVEPARVEPIEVEPASPVEEISEVAEDAAVEL